MAAFSEGAPLIRTAILPSSNKKGLHASEQLGGTSAHHQPVGSAFDQDLLPSALIALHTPNGFDIHQGAAVNLPKDFGVEFFHQFFDGLAN
jgi:hypothetical protein